MPNLHRLYRAGQAIVVYAAATPYRERSHFDGQDVLESGLPRPAKVESGWLNRALGALEAGESAQRPNGRRAFAVGPVTPLVVRGPAPVFSWAPPRLQPVADETTMRLLDLYRHTDPELARVWKIGWHWRRSPRRDRPVCGRKTWGRRRRSVISISSKPISARPRAGPAKLPPVRPGRGAVRWRWQGGEPMPTGGQGRGDGATGLGALMA